MSIRIADELAVWWPIKIRVPRDGGKPTEETVEVKFRVAKLSELNGKPSRQILLEHVLDWRGIEDPFSRENLERALDWPFWFTAFENALADCSRGAAAKN